MNRHINKSNNTDSNSVVSFEFAEDYLADIVVNFLGTKERLNFESDNKFILKFNDIEQFYYLIRDKIEKEQYTHINNFSVSIRYNDKTSRTISSIEALNRFLETRDVTSTGITLEWHIILKFPNSASIETQKIEVSFFTDQLSDDDTVKLSIEHTNQAWVIEILNLLKSKIKNVSIDTPKIVKKSTYIKEQMTFTNYFTVIAVIIFIFFLIKVSTKKPAIPTLGTPNEISEVTHLLLQGYYENNTKTSDQYKRGLFLLNNIHITQLSTVVDSHIKNKDVRMILTDYVEGEKEEIKKQVKLINQREPVYLSIIKTLFYYFIIPFLILYWLPQLYLNKTIEYYGSDSYLLITDNDKKNHSKYLESKNKYEYFTISGVLLSIVTGVIASYIITLLT